MVRFAATAVLASMFVLGALMPGAKQRGKPPSSLEPGDPRGKVTLSHAHERVVACAEKRGTGGLSCEPKQQSVELGTSLTLKPVPEAGVLSKEDRRAAVRVELDDEPSPQTEEVELAVGIWEVSWSGLRERPRFRVADEDEFEIELSTVVGSCKKAASKCVLLPSGQTRKVVVPARQRAE